MTDGQVCCGCIVVHPDGDDELNVAAADWRCWRRAYSYLQGSAAPCYLDTGGLVRPSLNSTRSATSSQCKSTCKCKTKCRLYTPFRFSQLMTEKIPTKHSAVVRIYDVRDGDVLLCIAIEATADFYSLLPK